MGHLSHVLLQGLGNHLPADTVRRTSSTVSLDDDIDPPSVYQPQLSLSGLENGGTANHSAEREPRAVVDRQVYLEYDLYDRLLSPGLFNIYSLLPVL